MKNVEKVAFMKKNRENEKFQGLSLTLCCKGTAVLRTGDTDCQVEAGSLMVHFLTSLAETVSRSDDYLERSVSISLDDILDFPSPVDIDVINLSLRYPVSVLDSSRSARMQAFYALLDMQKPCGTNAYRLEISRSILYAMILEVCDHFRSMSEESTDMPKPKQETLTDDFFKLLAKHCRQEHTVGFYADKLNRTPKYLSGAIRKLSGRSVPEWITMNLLRESKSMLKTTGMTVLEISEDLNFSSPSVFVQFFRRHTGLTPLQYRRRG